MAVAFVASRGSNTATAAGATFAIDLPAGASILAGNTLVASLAYRDVITPPTDPDAIPGDAVAQDTRGNLWRRVVTAANAGATSAAGDGAVASIWVCHVVFPYVNGDDIVFRAPITARPMTHVAGEIFEFSGVLRVDRALDNEATTGNSAAASLPGINPNAVGQLVFGTVAVATNPALTGDADATDGVWSAIASNSTAQIIRGSQYKIVTGTAAQTWDVTWAGAQRWATTAVVLQASTFAWPFNSTRLANPGYPCPAGPEILPTARTVTPVDTGTAYLFDTDIPPESVNSSGVYWLGDITIPKDNVDVQHRVCVDVYQRDAELSRTDPFIFTLGTPNFVVANNGAMTDPGGSTVSANLVAALAGAGGESVVLPDPGTVPGSPGSIDCYWDTSALIPLQDTHRILNLRVSYVAWKDNSAPATPGEGLAVYWRDSLAISADSALGVYSLYGAWLVNEYEVTAGRVYRNLGEVNGLPRLGANLGEQYANVQACWTIRDMLHMNTGDRTASFSLFGVRGSEDFQSQIFLDTVRLDVFLVPETRIAQSARRVTSGVGFPGVLADQGTGSKIQPLYKATDSSVFWQVPGEEPLTIAVREPIPASGSDWYSAQTDPDILTDVGIFGNARYSTQEPVGPSVCMKSITQPRSTLDPQVDVRRVEWSNGQIAPGAEPEPFGAMIQSIGLIDLNSYSGWWPQYTADNFLPETARTGSDITQLVGVDGATAYDTVKLLIKPSDLTVGDLVVTVEKPALTVLATATLTVADCLALPSVGNDYREVRLPLSSTIMPTSGSATIRLASVNAANAGWVPGAAYNEDGRFNYQSSPTAVPATAVDYAMVLCCPLADPDAEISTGEATFARTSDNCLVGSTDIPCVTIENAADYDYIAISRVVGSEIIPVTLLNGTDLGVEIEDTFTRVVAGGWGSTDTGQAWIDTGSPYSVSGGLGRITTAVAGNATINRVAFTDSNQEIQADFGVSALSTGNSQEAAILGRVTDASNMYVLRATFSTLGNISLVLGQVLGGVLSTLDSNLLLFGYTPGTLYRAKFSLQGNVLRGKIWDPATMVEPPWQVNFDDSASPLPLGTQTGLWGGRVAGNTNVASEAIFDNFQVMETSNPLEWCDYGVPWDLISASVYYRVTGYRENDRAEQSVLVGPWAGTSVAPGAAFGLATQDALYCYVPVSESGQLQITWNPLNPIESMPLAGKDYQVALRVAEQRGLQVTVTVVADQFQVCEVEGLGLYDESLPYDDDGSYDGTQYSSRSPGAKSMSPVPYALIRALENEDRLTLKLPGGHTRYVTLDVGALASTPVFGVYLAEITLTDCVVPGTYPYVAPGGEPVEL